MMYTENDGEPKPTDSQARPSISQGSLNPYWEGRARESATEENAHSPITTLEGRARESATEENTHSPITTLEGRARESATEENAHSPITTLEGRARESVFSESSITLTHP